MTKMLRVLLAAALAIGTGFAGAGIAAAQTQEDTDNEATVQQHGSSSSGDAVGGQVVGIVSSGDASVDARNTSEDVDVETGVADTFNFTAADVGLIVGEADADVTQSDTDNTVEVTQTAGASSGDAVGGQVIGVVTSAGGSAEVVAENTSIDVDAETGVADAFNDAFVFAGLVTSTTDTAVSQTDVDNDVDVDQTAAASTGDAVGGQVIGVVSAGDASVDARNLSEDLDAETGVATAENAAFAGAGLDVEFPGDTPSVAQEDVDNEVGIGQTAASSTGDAVGGQVIGVVTSAGGSADVVAENTSLDVDVETGVASATNTGFGSAGALVGFANAADVTQSDTDNATSITQAATASTGDAVGGQVLGVVSAGDTSLDARNRSEDVSVESGAANADNFAGAFSGLDVLFVGDADVAQTDVSNDATIGQTADASTGDAVGGQVAGVVTSAGGSVEAVLENTSVDVDAESGVVTHGNFGDTFAGQRVFF